MAAPPKRTRRVWPLHFETNGSAYTLDAKSGRFHDEESDFYYDPKLKLYFGKSAYYRYNADLKPPFEQVDHTDDVQPQVIQPEKKQAPIINIKLKTKSLKRKEPPSKQQKEHAADMEKWSGRQEEMRKAICWLCRRKFKSEEKLRYHEKESQMHRDNLAKKGNYKDRAEERKAMHGPEETVAAVAPVVAPMVEPAKPEAESLGESNVGRQMLEKLGWKGEPENGQQKQLKKDWERIETAAKK